MKIQLSLRWIMKFSYAYIVILRSQLLMQIWTISFKMICLRQVLLFFTLLVSIQALDKCLENVQTVDALNVEEYFGYWYHTYGNINRNAQEGNRCIRATYQSFNETGLSVRNVAIRVGNTEFSQVCGYAWQYEMDKNPGKLLVEFHPGSPPGTYWILGTDYDNYACVYSCSQYDGYANLSAWVLTRDPYPTLETIEQCLDIFIDNEVDVADFISFSQENCDYGIVDNNSCEL